MSEANIHDHWTKKLKRKNLIKRAIYYEWKGSHMRNLKPPIEITLTRIAPRLLDSDNLVSSLKTVQDSVADLLIPGLAPGQADNSPDIKFHYQQEKGKPKEYALRIEAKQF